MDNISNNYVEVNDEVQIKAPPKFGSKNKKAIPKTATKEISKKVVEDNSFLELAINGDFDKAEALLKSKKKPAQPKQRNGLAPTLEYIYINRRNPNKERIIDDYRKETSFIYKWDSEKWQVQDPEVIKKEISNWLETQHKDKLTAKQTSSIYSVFYSSLEPLPPVDLSQVIIPTKKHWLVADQITGIYTAIKPNKNIGIKHQVNVEIKNEGVYTPKGRKIGKGSRHVFYNYINSSLPETDKKDLVQEYAGYTLTNSIRKHKFMFFIGDGGNGKSQFLEMLVAINSNSVSCRMENIGLYNDNLIGKNLIHCPETDKKGFDQEFLKAAVAGDELEIRGIRKDKVSVRLHAKWILNGNSNFNISDFSNGLYRRMLIVRWNNNFEGSTKKVEDLAKLVIDNELDIFLDWCLLGLQRMIKNQWKFTECKDSEVALNEFKNEADKVRMFISEHEFKYSYTEESQGAYESKQEIYNMFIKWATENGYEKLNTVNFWKRMSGVIPEIQKDIASNLRKQGERVVYLSYSKSIPEFQPANT